MGSSPRGWSHIQFNNEYKAIRNAIYNVNERRYEVILRENVTNNDIQNAIIENKPTIIHFSGHGTENFLITHDGKDYGQEDQINNQNFVNIIKRAKSVKCVVLSCCYSKQLAEDLIKLKHIESVIGTSDEIKNDTCIIFAKGFYLSKANGYTYKEAFENGKDKVSINQISGASLLQYHGESDISITESPIKPLKKKKSTHVFIAIGIVFLCSLGFWLFKIPPKKESNPIVMTVPIVFEKDGLYGYKVDNNITIKPKFYSASEFKNGRALVGVADSVYYIDMKGNWLKTKSRLQITETKYVKKRIPNCSKCELEGWFSVDKNENIIDFKPNSKIAVIHKKYKDGKPLGHILPNEIGTFSYSLKYMICESDKTRDLNNIVRQEKMPEYLFSNYKSYFIDHPNDIISFYLCKSAAEQGHLKAQNNLGVLYEKGVNTSVPINYNKAFKWYLKAAKQGLRESQGAVGLFYYKGISVNKNDEEALKWTLSAAEKGDTRSEYLLGVFFETGDIVSQNFDKAKMWYEKAALKGLPEAKNRLDSISKYY